MISLFQSDVLDKLKDIDDETIDLIITSPPYNLGNTHHTRSNFHKTYDDDMPEDEYQQWQTNILDECYRVLRKNGSMMYNHKNRIRKGISIIPYQWIFKSKFLVKQEIVWRNGTPNFDKIRFYPSTERVYWLVKDSKTKLENNISSDEIFYWKPVGIKGEHKRAFPEEMVDNIISCFPNAKDVLDPFMGSGTVGVVCAKRKLNFIGIDIDANFVELARKRIETII